MNMVGNSDLPMSPDPAWEQSALRELVRKYPNGGSCHERALRDALRLGFAAASSGGAAGPAAHPLPETTSETQHV